MTTPQFMKGPSRLREIFSGFATSALPAILSVCREEWQMPVVELPDPQRYDAFEAYSARDGDYPLIGMFVVNDRNFIRVGYDDTMAEEYQARYECRFFVAVVTPDDDQGVQLDDPYEMTIRMRDNMTTALRMLLLTYPTMGATGECTILEDTLATDYPDALLFKTQGKRYVASGVITTTVQMTEKLRRDPIGVAQYIQVHPANL